MTNHNTTLESKIPSRVVLRAPRPNDWLSPLTKLKFG